MNLDQLLNYGVATAFAFILLFFLMKVIYGNIKDLGKQHKEIIDAGCHNNKIAKEILQSLKDLNKK